MATQRREDSNGDTIERRVLSDGREYDIVKNFPTETGTFCSRQWIWNGHRVQGVARRETLGADVQVWQNAR